MRRSDSSNDHLYNNNWRKNPHDTLACDIETYPGQWITDYFKEGQYESLIDYGNNIYTHHPIEVIRTIYDHPQFQHLTLSQIAKAVKFCSTYRQGTLDQDPWKEGDRFRYNRFYHLQTSPSETIELVAAQLGFHCRCCTNMIWQGRSDKDIGNHEGRPFWSGDYDYAEYKEMEKDEWIFSNLFRGGSFIYGLKLRPFCDSCLKIAERGTRRYFHQEVINKLGETNIALRGVLHLYKSFIPKRVKKDSQLNDRQKSRNQLHHLSEMGGAPT